MSEAEKRKWDERYAAGSYSSRKHPTALLCEWIDRVPRGRALDVACGRGRNALFLAEHGFEVDAVDISATALALLAHEAGERDLAVRTIEADLDAGANALPRGPYSLIVLVRYVNLPLLPALISRLDENGVLLCEEHLVWDASVVGPKSERFRLRPGELAAAAEDLRSLYYREGIVQDPDGHYAALAQLVGRRCRRLHKPKSDSE